MPLTVAAPKGIFTFADVATLLSLGRFVNIPLTGWSTSLSGGGAVTQTLVNNLVCNTSTTPNSVADAYSQFRGFNTNAANTAFNFSKKLHVFLDIYVGLSDAQCIRRILLANSTLSDDLTATGLGIKILNNAVWGMSFGSALGLVNLNFSASGSYTHSVEIVHMPGVRTDWYVNNALAGSQTDTTKIPSASVVINPSVVVKNGAAGGVDCTLGLTRFQLWQEK